MLFFVPSSTVNGIKAVAIHPKRIELSKGSPPRTKITVTTAAMKSNRRISLATVAVRVKDNARGEESG